MPTPIPEPSLFRKKPVVVSAVQYPCTHPALRRCSCDANSACSSCGREFIMTLEGPLNVSPGDWIITGVQGEHYPCKPDIFAATYEPASGQAEPITAALDPDSRGASVGVWQGSHCIYTGAHAVPVAPGDAQDERPAFEAWAKKKKMPLARIGEQYDDFWVDHAWNGWKARASVAAPAAGDALELVRLRRIAWLIGSIFVHGDFKAETVNERELEKLLRENGTFWDSLAQFGAALAAQVPQQGEA